MVYLLSGPDKRRKIAMTQLFVLIFFTLLLVFYVTALIIITGQIMFPGELDINGFIRLNVGWIGLLLFFGGMCFASSCIFNDSKNASGVSLAIVIYSILVQMVSQVGEKSVYLIFLIRRSFYE